MSRPDSPKSAVYTVLLGGYEKLNDKQEIGDGSTDFLCFTDDADLSSDVWEIQVVTPLFVRDLQRSQREFKMCGHPALDEYARTLYIDNSVSLTAPPEQILDRWLQSSDVAIPQHSFRPTVLDEFGVVVEIGLDEPARVYEQLYHYSEDDPTVLEEVPLWNGMIARRNTPEVRAVMVRWFNEVLRYSRRDQLSANRIVGRSGVRLNRVEIDNHKSDIHEWPMMMARKNIVNRQAQTRAIPNLARIRELESALARQIERAETSERYVHELEKTRSWLLAKRISSLASVLRPGSRSTRFGRTHHK